MDEISKGENWDDYDYELETQKETLTYVSQDIFDNMFIGHTPYVKVEDWEDSITKDAEIITSTTLKKKNHYVSNYDAKEKDDYNINERRYVFVKEFTDEELIDRLREGEHQITDFIMEKYSKQYLRFII